MSGHPVRRKVLIVEDAPTVRSLLQVYLMGPDLELFEAADGEAGFALAREIRPDLILTDVSMPGMDGFELCAAVRSEPSLHAIPIVMLTALSDELTRRKGRLVGASAFLNKPVTVDQLRSTIRGLLSR